MTNDPEWPPGSQPQPGAPPSGEESRGYAAERPYDPRFPGPFAEWWRRALARVLDFLLLAPINVVVFALVVWPEFSDWIDTVVDAPAGESRDLPSELLTRLTVFGLAIAALFFLYEWVLIARFGATVGKLALGIRVTDENGRAPGWTSSGQRLLIPVGGSIVGAIPVLGTLASLGVFIAYLSFVWDARKQSWNDKVAGTFVVTPRRH